jgi:hypothetical protein
MHTNHNAYSACYAISGKIIHHFIKIKTEDNFADILSKPLKSMLFIPIIMNALFCVKYCGLNMLWNKQGEVVLL